MTVPPMKARMGAVYELKEGRGAGSAIKFEHLPFGEKSSVGSFNSPTTRATTKKRKI